MKALVREKAGKNFSGVKLQEIPAPMPGTGELLVRMAASRINPVDLDLMKGMPFIRYKKPAIGGVDGAGTVIAVGAGVTNFNASDKVFFYRRFDD